MEPKLKFTLVSIVIAFTSYYLFRYLHVLFNNFMFSRNPSFTEKYPWVFTTRSHTYVFLIMLLKLGVVIAFIWLELIGVPKILQH